MCCGAWRSWRRRNILAFGDEYLRDNRLLHQIYFLKDMCCGAWNSPKMVHRHFTIISWLRPEEGFIRNLRRIGFGGFLKFFERRWLMGFTGYGGFGFSRTASN
jgi:hypothetical protein